VKKWLEKEDKGDKQFKIRLEKFAQVEPAAYGGSALQAPPFKRTGACTRPRNFCLLFLGCANDTLRVACFWAGVRKTQN